MNDAEAMEMPRYKCHKEVWALKIKSIEYELAPTQGIQCGPCTLTFEDARYSPVTLGRPLTGNPQAGGYYVVYAGGYNSFSPAKAFEDGYTLVS